jgi:PBP4 family serine-type D-alanyl-D-alanine carboxypeptidase
LHLTVFRKTFVRVSSREHVTNSEIQALKTESCCAHNHFIAAIVRAVSFAAFLLLLSGCAILQPGGRPSDPLDALRFDIEQVLADSIFIPSQASVKIVSLDARELLYEHNSKLLMRPASNMKLLTSSAALSILGPQYQLRTVILADSSSPDSAISGNIYIKGYGDPDLLTADLDSLATQVQQRGVRSVCGGVVADISFYDDLYWGHGWIWDDEPDSYAAFITPLAVNDNCVDVTVTPADSAGRSVSVAVAPSTSYITLVNKASTVPDSVMNPLVVTRLFKERLNTILVEGEMKQGGRTVKEQISVWKPELYAATLFEEALQRRGISVSGEPAAGLAPATAREMASCSRNLVPALINLNKVSDNLSAEMMLKTVSAVTDKVPGSARGGTYAVNRFLSTFGIDTTKYCLADGSGLSNYNLISAELIIQLLQGMAQRRELFPTFLESLPIAGVDGTLGNRMKNTPAEGNLKAKTGTISGVSSLSGYVHTADGETLAFAMTMQNFTYPTRLYQRAQDKIGALLAGFSRHGRAALPRR